MTDTEQELLSFGLIDIDEISTGYKSPITMTFTDLNHEYDGLIYKAVQRCGVDVNKDELIKVLKYDRDQYNKGYQDGMVRLAQKITAVLREHNASFGMLTEIVADILREEF